MKIEKIFITLIILLFASSGLWAQIDFFKENLQFDLKENSFSVEGDYYFRNVGDHDIKVTLFYPIPRDSILGAYDSVSVTGPSQQTDSPITVMKENGFFFNVAIGANKSAIYTIAYRQELLGNKAKYIFTTTNTWGKPLECASFRLTFPKNIRIDSLSTIPDSLLEINNTYTVFWTRKRFMPKEDLVILFHEEEEKDISEIDFKDKNTFVYFRFTPLLIPGIAAGYVKRQHKLGGGFTDYIIVANYHFYTGYHESYGLSLVTERFKYYQPKGIFYRLNIGFEYGYFFNPLDEGQNSKKILVPNITWGMGYGFSNGNSSSFRLCFEIGITSILGRMNLELVF